MKTTIFRKLFRKSTILLGFALIPNLQGCVFAVASGAATGAAIATDRRTTGTILDDQTIELKAMHAIAKNHTLWDESHININSYNNVILLTGQTPSEALKQEAEEAVSTIPKVRQIHNELSIGSPSSLGTRSKDSWITTQIKTKMIGRKEINASRIKVVTEESVVYLMGLTTPEEEQIATEIAQNISGVEKVVQIFEPSETSSETVKTSEKINNEVDSSNKNLGSSNKASSYEQVSAPEEELVPPES